MIIMFVFDMVPTIMPVSNKDVNMFLVARNIGEHVVMIVRAILIVNDDNKEQEQMKLCAFSVNARVDESMSILSQRGYYVRAQRNHALERHPWYWSWSR
jgi:hypothetical protein